MNLTFLHSFSEKLRANSTATVYAVCNGVRAFWIQQSTAERKHECHRRAYIWMILDGSLQPCLKRFWTGSFP